MAANEFPLSVRGLTKIYPSFRLDGVSFDLRPGAVTGFIGRNGAGKTTTLNSLLGFVRPDGGEALFWGMDIGRHADAIKWRIGFVSAGMTYYTRKKIRTITEVTKSFYPGWSDDTYGKYMRRFGLEESKTPAALSNGMKIKYALALALSHGAELLILDEPTSGLDPVSREELTEIFLSLKDEGKTILFSTHITADLEKCADRILYIRAGRLAADSAMDDFAGAYRIAAFDGEAPAEMKSAALGICRTRKGGTALLKKEDAAAICADWQIPTLDEIMTHLDREEAEDA
ncbi:MAG: ABC transporter ATP-binding protein [Clostridia bacterium]|nr:ABC transporter ATP-binding protein [Clostridia bacterium]